MTNRLACIGIRVEGAEEYGRLLEALLAEGVTEQGPGVSALNTWQDPSGAALVASLGASGDVECVNPSFFGTAELSVIPRRIASDPSCSFCDPLVVDVVDDAGEVVHPMAVKLDDLALTRPRLPIDQPATLACAALAQDVEAFGNAAAFDDWQRENPVRYATESALPSGLLGADGTETPEVLLTGTVLDSELRVNQATGSPFHWVSVRSLPGVIDVVAPAEAFATRPQPGAVVHGTFWMVGRITSGLLPGPSPRPRRRFGLRRPEGRRR